eukprot:m.559033 g.559033  ORF g.559033 m.559033 type:complete len:337 (-) comp22203_c0_seq8:730-1740(-)
MATSKIVRIALDWTPNTNHTGMYVANANKWYEAAGLEVKFVVPTENSTPARMLAAGEVEIAIAPSESAISFATTDTKNTIAAVAAILQRSTSAICTLQSSGIASPKGLENKRYASYSGRFEDCIVQQMVKNDGGDGSKVQFHGLEGHGYGDDIQESTSVVATYLKTGKSDSTWIFKHWEGILAGTDTLNYFDLEHYKIPYGYSPVMLAMVPGTSSATDAAWLARFLEATARGYVFADAHPDEAARLLCEQVESLADKVEFVSQSQRALQGAHLTSAGQWGIMEEDRWEAFLQFLCDNDIIRSRDGYTCLKRSDVNLNKVQTNRFLPSWHGEKEAST